MKKYKIGFTSGVYDLFHVGHLNILKRAKEYCDYLIVGVTTDEVALSAKHKLPVIPFNERCEIVESIKYVDKVVPQTSYEIEGKIKAAKENNIDVMFVGSDWKGTDKWNEIERELAKLNIIVVYLPHTDGVSSSSIRKGLSK